MGCSSPRSSAPGSLATPAQASCAAPANEIEAENCKAGAPRAEWYVDGVGEGNVAGFATDISVDQGQQVGFKVDATAPYVLDIYRLGWYGGDGAHFIERLDAPEHARPAAMRHRGGDRPRRLRQLGAHEHLERARERDVGDLPRRRQARPARSPTSSSSSATTTAARTLLFQTSDTTWQAYNQYGGNSLYTGGPGPQGGAYKVSYNRPFTTAASYADEDWLFNGEYPMVRWLERNGYDVSYFTGVDSDRRGAEIREHRAFLSVGHDEYWSSGQRAHVEAARDAGVQLAFFSGNEVFWKTRWENDHQTLVSYKETHAGYKIDPTGTWTGTWRDPRSFNPEGPRPENSLTGTLFRVNSDTRSLEVPAADGLLRFWRGTSLASQAPGATAALPVGTLGYEWDEAPADGARPAGLVQLSRTYAGACRCSRTTARSTRPGRRPTI